jgi:hypothetical protein
VCVCVYVCTHIYIQVYRLPGGRCRAKRHVDPVIQAPWYILRYSIKRGGWGGINLHYICQEADAGETRIYVCIYTFYIYIYISLYIYTCQDAELGRPDTITRCSERRRFRGGARGGGPIFIFIVYLCGEGPFLFYLVKTTK